jgi:hypothetical protein
MIETDPRFDRTRPLAPELSTKRRVFPSCGIASGQMLLPRRDPLAKSTSIPDRAMDFLVGVDPDDLTGHERLVAALEKDGEFESKA